MSKLKFSRVEYNRKQLGICPITGISITIEVPVIPNKIYSYPHPLSIIPNAIGIAKLSYKEKLSLGNEILAGVCLSLLSHYKLINDKLSSTERNLILQQVSPYTLHELSFRIATASRSTISNWPRISLTEASAYTVTDYFAIISGAVESSTTATYSYSTTAKIKKEKKQKNLSPELRKLIKSLILEITPFFNAKVIQVLQIMSQGNNLYSLNDSLRTKLVDKLSAVENVKSLELAEIIKNAATDSEAMDELFSPLPTSKSLKEILAEKQGKPLPIEVEQETEEVQNIEDIFYPSFSHLDCDSCEYEMTSCKTLGYCYIKEQESTEKLHSVLGLLKEVADEMGIPTNLEYIEEENEEDENEGTETENSSIEQAVLSEEEISHDEF